MRLRDMIMTTTMMRPRNNRITSSSSSSSSSSNISPPSGEYPYSQLSSSFPTTTATKEHVVVEVTHHPLEMSDTSLHNNDTPIDDNDGAATTATTTTTGSTSTMETVMNLTKCICGAGSFALPHVFLEQGILGGTLAMTVCGALATFTMQTLATAARRQRQQQQDALSSSYVALATAALGKPAGHVVFALTLCASLGVCSTYLVFIGETMASLASEWLLLGTTNVTSVAWQFGTVVAVVPLCTIRDYSIFAFTSTAGVLAVMGGILVTLASGLRVDPGWEAALQGLYTVPLWPSSLAVAFGNSFGTIAYLFCINFLTFPIMNSIQQPEHYGWAVQVAVSGVWMVNVVFAILCLGFYGDNTKELVLSNLGNGPYLAALKLLLCVDLFFTFPIVFSSGRQILENAVGLGDNNDGHNSEEISQRQFQRTVLVTGAVGVCFGMAQLGGFAVVTNLVGGVAQGTLAFIMPPAIALSIAKQQRKATTAWTTERDLIVQWLVVGFGVVVVSSVTYSTIVGIL